MTADHARSETGHEAERLPPLDGIRGLAVLAVMISHFYGLQRFKDLLWTDRIYGSLADGGWIGVDLFFVLSGFLITGILYDSKGGPGYFRSFYMRRVLRIFPLYYGFLFLVFVVAPMVLASPPADLQWLQDHQWWYWLYIPNFLGAKFTDHIPGYTGHLWSLAIEEQFYICWPLVVFLCSRKTLLRLCSGVIIVSLLLRIGFRLTDVPRDWVYIVTPARLDGLACGALVTLLIRSESGRALVARWAKPVALVCGALVAGLWMYYGRISWWNNPTGTFGLSLIALAFGGLVGMAVTRPSTNWLPNALSHPVLVFFGKYSYAMYVFQNPVMFFFEETAFHPAKTFPTLAGSQLPGSFIQLAAGIGITTVLALASWHLYEKHFLKLKRLFPYGRKTHAETRRLSEAEAQALALPEPAASDPARQP
jgi:peptidoglycan/LPS O-acetylase OafA/YrhL